MNWMPYIFCVVGSMICFLNLYTSFVRPYWIRWRHDIPFDQQQHVSGAPLFGSLLAVAGAFALPDNSGLFAPVLLIAFFDTGGLHVFAAVMIYQKLKGQ